MMAKFRHRLIAAAMAWAGITAILTMAGWLLASFVNWEIVSIFDKSGRFLIALTALGSLYLVGKSWDRKQ
jgi:hypothetical protein